MPQQAVSELAPASTSGFNWSMGVSAVGVALPGLVTVILPAYGLLEKDAHHP